MPQLRVCDLIQGKGSMGLDELSLEPSAGCSGIKTTCPRRGCSGPSMAFGAAGILVA